LSIAGAKKLLLLFYCHLLTACSFKDVANNISIMEMIKLNTILKRTCYILVLILVFFSAFRSAAGEKDADTNSIVQAVSDQKPPAVNALAAIVVEESSGRILFAKNAGQKRSIASTTKIMTALVALENGNLDDTVTISKRAAAIGGSTVGLREGEKYTLRELLFAMLMISGNDAAIAVAEHVGGSVEHFAEMMNKKAQSIGAVNSNFVTPHGLDRENQYSTASDLAIITIEALKNPVFAEIVSTTNSSISGHHLYNTNELLGNCQGVDWVKTGYTGKAGRCLVTSARRGEMHLISVVLGSPTKNARASASRAMLEYCFDNFSMHRLLQAGEVYARVPVYRGIGQTIELRAEHDVKVPLSDLELDMMKAQSSIPEVLKAPVYAGVDTGFVEYEVNGEVVGRSMLKTSTNIRKKNYSDYLYEVLQSWSRMMRDGLFSGIYGAGKAGGIVLPRNTTGIFECFSGNSNS
jgi:D-alanyl-D-alanine carboxypeptidase (penicillin-binding protein 5/6)